MERRDLVKVIIAAICIIGGGLLIGQAYPLILPPQASAEAIQYDQLFYVVFSLGGMIFLLVEGALIYSLIKFRAKPGDDSEGPPIHDNPPLETAWTVVPLLLVLGISYYSFGVLKVVDFNYSQLGRWFHGPLPPGEVLAEPLTGGDVVVKVTGLQYAWTFSYPTYGITSPELHVPIDKLVLLRITAKDVIHSFWVPDFRLKKDANPGTVNEMRFTANKLGTYPIVCAELCGMGHQAMRASLVVQSQTDFEAWVKGAGTGQQATNTDQTARNIIVAQGCGACHALKDANVSGQVGPPLDGLGARADGRAPGLSAADYIRQSLTDPRSFIAPGYIDAMPTFKDRLSGPELDLLVTYLLKQ